MWQRFWRWLFPPGMKVMIQWAKKTPDGWEQLDAKDWKHLPKKDKPKKGELGGQDDSKGWVRNVNVQGITCEGYDHVAIEPITIGNDEGVKMTVWNDDPDDAHVDGFEDWVNEPQAIVWTIMPLASDPKLGMAINTRQSCKRYAQGERYNRLLAHPPQNTTVRPWTDFVPPSEEITRHGVWLENEKHQEHLDKAPQHEWGWMHWCDHLPESETETEDEITHHKVPKKINPRRKLKEQRAQGRYKQAEHTITYYQRDTDSAAGFEVYVNEDALSLTTTTSTTESATTNSGGIASWVFSSPSGQPNSADWPSGSFNIQYNVTAASVGVTYDVGGTGTSGFMRVASDLSAVSEQGNSSTSSGSGTGLKLFTLSKDYVAGNAADRYSIGQLATGDSHGDALTIQLNTTDSYADGPWSTDTSFPTTNQPLIITS